MRHKYFTIDNVDIFYREAGNPNNPTIVLLHGYPSSSYMYRNLIPVLAANYHVLAPDFPGFGFSSSPSLDKFEYSFEHFANLIQQWLDEIEIRTFFLYVQDYGAPVGFRIASSNPKGVRGLIIQNGNAYAEGLTDAWQGIQAYWQDKTAEHADQLRALCSPEFIRQMYTEGCQHPENIAPEAWTLDSHFLLDQHRVEIQLELFHNYSTNVESYQKWQNYFRSHQPPTLVVWGLNDMFFSKYGAESYKKDLYDIEYHYYDTGHFALEEEVSSIAVATIGFLERVLQIT